MVFDLTRNTVQLASQNVCFFSRIFLPREDTMNFPQCIASTEIFCTGGHSGC